MVIFLLPSMFTVERDSDAKAANRVLSELRWSGSDSGLIFLEYLSQHSHKWDERLLPMRWNILLSGQTNIRSNGHRMWLYSKITRTYNCLPVGIPVNTISIKMGHDEKWIIWSCYIRGKQSRETGNRVQQMAFIFSLFTIYILYFVIFVYTTFNDMRKI